MVSNQNKTQLAKAATKSNQDNSVAALEGVRSVKEFAVTLQTPRLQSEIKSSLPPEISIKRFNATTIAAIRHNPELLEADGASLFNAIIRCASDGLMPDGRDAILNIYNTKENDKWIKLVQYQRMVGGVIKQFRKAGIDAYACSVYEFDEIDMWNDEAGQHVTHRPVPFGARGNLIGVFAVASAKDMKPVIVRMNLDDIAKARASSKSGDGPKSPWVLWFDQMAEKSCLHRLRKRVAVLNEDAAAELDAIDDEFEDDPAPTRAAPQAPVTPTSGKAADRPAVLQNIVDKGNSGDEPGPGDLV